MICHAYMKGVHYDGKMWTYPHLFIESPSLAFTSAATASQIYGAPNTVGWILITNSYANVKTQASPTNSNGITGLAVGYWK